MACYFWLSITNLAIVWIVIVHGDDTTPSDPSATVSSDPGDTSSEGSTPSMGGSSDSTTLDPSTPLGGSNPSSEPGSATPGGETSGPENISPTTLDPSATPGGSNSSSGPQSFATGVGSNTTGGENIGRGGNKDPKAEALWTKWNSMGMSNDDESWLMKYCPRGLTPSFEKVCIVHCWENGWQGGRCTEYGICVCLWNGIDSLGMKSDGKPGKQNVPRIIAAEHEDDTSQPGGSNVTSDGLTSAPGGSTPLTGGSNATSDGPTPAPGGSTPLTGGSTSDTSESTSDTTGSTSDTSGSTSDTGESTSDTGESTSDTGESTSDSSETTQPAG